MLRNTIYLAKKSLYPANFADATWTEIVEACANREVPETWKVFNTKSMTINGTSYQIDIIGENHDDYADGSGKAPLSFQLHDCYNLNGYMADPYDSNADGWSNCKMRITNLPDILTKMPSEVQAGIKEVNKKTSAGNKSSTIKTTADKLFLLSEVEIFGKITKSVSGEGNQYAYYSAGGSAVKKIGSTARKWWERSPESGSTVEYCFVSTSGTASSDLSTCYISFAFCF